MEDDRGIELSLGLGCGPTSSPSKDRSENSADDKMDTDERTSKILSDFRNFLNAGASQSSQRTDLVKPSANFFNNFPQTASGGNDLSNVDMEKHKNQEIDSDSSDLQVKEVHSHISITTDDEGSTGDNEDMAESEVEVSTSKISPHCDDESRTLGGSASSSQAPKESGGMANISASSFPVQSVNATSVPYSTTVKESPSASSLNTPIYPSMPSIPPTTAGHSHPHAASTASVPVTLTYSSLQIPNKDSSWGMARPQPLHSPYATRLAPSSASMQVTNLNSSEATRPDVGLREQLRRLQKGVGQVGPSSQPVGNATTRTSSSSFPSEYPAIKPGIASEVKFGGSGSFPNLPWVSTTGPGPNGKTISGVTYKFNATQIKIVCACHGIHLSPEEFVRHATEDQSRVVPATGLASLRSSNPGTTSAMS